MGSRTKWLYLVLLTACASGLEGPDRFDAPVIDAPIFEFPDTSVTPRPDAFQKPDAGPLQDIGGPCDDGSGCKDGVCILGSVGGYCSRICTAGSCPPGYGCLGVTGVIEPGHVTFVCVKDFTLLCSPCASSTECGVDEDNLCLPAPTGGSFCGRDCSTVTCPDGYVCQAASPGDAGPAKMQCVPMSGACDCDATHQGMTKPCPLTTPFDTACTGVRTCQGVSGWGDCQAPAVTDIPDGNFADENCDGIDGTVSDGVFVVTPPNGGADSDDCGPSRLNPCATISKGAQHAKLLNRHYVFVQAGTYQETVVMTDGVSVFGGYDSTWQRADRTRPGHEVVIQGVLYAVDDQVVAIVAHDLTMPTTIGDVTIDGGNASGSSNRAGRSSYGIHVDNAHLSVERVTINAGRGAPGATGGTGMDAAGVNATPTMAGKIGGQGNQNDCCDSDARGAGGDPGQNSCADHGGDNPGAGKGGAGGTEDSSCVDVPFCAVCAGDACNATGGIVGGHATVSSAQFGFGGAGGIGDDSDGNTICSAGMPGGSGLVSNGPGGMGGDGGGRVVNGYWYAFFGQDGQVGKNGSGGGGGGGSGGCDTGSPDTYGAGGGGGGAGGCAALSGGQGGEGGGGSFGVFATGSTLKLRNLIIVQADAARAGDGGVGGRGQDGGAGGPEGPVTPGGSARNGGKGGDGAHGGHGGGGGGGAGGVSYGVFTTADTALDLDGSTTITDNGISGGDPGGPGASAPTAPQPGNSGFTGTPGVEGKTLVCTNPAHC